MLRKFLLGGRTTAALAVENDGARGGGALIQRENEAAGHDRTLEPPLLAAKLALADLPLWRVPILGFLTTPHIVNSLASDFWLLSPDFLALVPFGPAKSDRGLRAAAQPVQLER